MRVRTHVFDGNLYLLAEDVIRSLAPLTETVRHLVADVRVAATLEKAPTRPKATKKRRTKAELVEAVRELAHVSPNADVARRLGISEGTVARLRGMIVAGEA
jgi:hypothetical protein